MWRNPTLYSNRTTQATGDIRVVSDIETYRDITSIDVTMEGGFQWSSY